MILKLIYYKNVIDSNFQKLSLVLHFSASSWKRCPIYFSLCPLQEDFIDGQKDDWRYIGIVIDRLFFWIFTIIIILGTLACLLNAPALYDNTIPVEQLVRNKQIGNKEENWTSNSISTCFLSSLSSVFSPSAELILSACKWCGRVICLTSHFT